MPRSQSPAPQSCASMDSRPSSEATRRLRTLRRLATVKLKKINPAISLFLNYVTPLPGSDVFRIAVERGHLEAPRTFADWARFDYMQPNLVDITDEYRRCVSRFQEFLHLAYPLPGRRRLPEPVARGACRRTNATRVAVIRTSRRPVRR